MRVQLHCIARIRVVYLNGLTSLLLSWYNPLPAEPPLSPRSTEKKCRTDANSSSRKKGLTEPGSLTNTNIIEKNCLFCILSPIPLLPRALRNRSDHIDIPSTQHRSSKGSRTTHQSTKARIFQKMDSYSKSA
uniref:Ycf15 n=1 Tax=Stephania tetrandra TaxID=425106 RepID=A0A8F0K2J9_9MAGN|nr:Ycf15 [Stephania tetrandra]QWK45258.1 Ycf15 [Stephania tetrandra]